MKFSKYIFFLLPIIELMLFIEIGSIYGSIFVILSIFITMLIGYYLIRQKLRSIGVGLFNLSNINNLYTQYTSDIYSILGGILLIIPGYLTDTVGLFMFIPLFRPKISKYFDMKYSKKPSKNNVIDGDYRDGE